ncbi:MAG: hypothetical protein Q7S40_08320 [Opitutaceae bacterium]|nr:hypothetical protein [Opitutaceae bacterium]
MDTSRGFKNAPEDPLLLAEECKFSLIFGVWDAEGPHLFQINSKDYMPFKCKNGIATIGTGQILADYILDGINPKEMFFEDVLMLGIYCVEMVTNKEGQCEGAARAGVIADHGPWEYPQEDAETHAKECRGFEKHHKQVWLQMLGDELIGEWRG